MGKVVDVGNKLAARRLAHIKLDASEGRTRRIRFTINETFVAVENYAFLSSFFYECNDAGQEALSLVFSGIRVLLVGRNLRALLDAIQDEGVRAIEPYNPERHEEPKEGAPVVEQCFYQKADEVIAQAAAD